jgi:hypothetical protein
VINKFLGLSLWKTLKRADIFFSSGHAWQIFKTLFIVSIPAGFSKGYYTDILLLSEVTLVQEGGCKCNGRGKRLRQNRRPVDDRAGAEPPLMVGCVALFLCPGHFAVDSHLSDS